MMTAQKILRSSAPEVKRRGQHLSGMCPFLGCNPGAPPSRDNGYLMNHGFDVTPRKSCLPAGTMIQCVKSYLRFTPRTATRPAISVPR
jgi:hypothetical protein